MIFEKYHFFRPDPIPRGISIILVLKKTLLVMELEGHMVEQTTRWDLSSMTSWINIKAMPRALATSRCVGVSPWRTSKAHEVILNCCCPEAVALKT